MVRLLKGLVALVGALWLAIAGVGGMWWWDRRPPQTPSFAFKVLFWPVKWTAPESLKAQLDGYRARERLALRRTQMIEAGQAAVSQEIGRKVEAAQAQIRERTKILIERVPVYVTPETDARYRLPWGFVRLHDAAAAGALLPAVPDAAAEPHDAPAPVAVSDAGRTIALNYGACHANAAQLAGWIEWARGVKAVEAEADAGGTLPES